jgi:hypothetical protein
MNEIGEAAARGREVLSRVEAERQLTEALGHTVELPDRAVVSHGPTTCPACGSPNLLWGHAPEQTRRPEQCHPLIWNEIDVLADTFMCRDCNAGWFEPDKPEPITWVRPYWIDEG